jgi:hypothetical protein
MRKIILFLLMTYVLLFESKDMLSQIAVNETFDATTTPTGWTYSGFARTTTTPCTGTASVRRNIYSSVPTGNIAAPVFTSSGNDLTISFSYKIINFTGGAGTPNTFGSIITEVSTDGGTTYPIVANTISTGHVPATTCATVPLITVLGSSLPSGNNCRVRLRAVWATGDYYVYFDNVQINQLGNPCSGTPATAVVPATAGFCGTSGVVTLNATNTGGFTGISYQWEESNDNGVADAWENAVGGTGATTVSYTSPTISTNIYYRLKVTCANGGASSVSNSCNVNPVNCSFDVSKTNNSFSSISGTGTSMSGWRNGTTNTDDNLSTAQPIGFNFSYKGQTFSQFSASTNGFMTFNVGTSALGNGTGVYGYENTTLTSSTGSLNTLAPFYEDLVTTGNPGNLAGLNAGLKYQLTGSAPNRVLTVEWIGFETFGNAGPNLNFQVKLYETTNVIEYVYGTMEMFNGTANYSYTYSLGLNGPAISTTPTVQELQTQQVANVQNFAPIAANALVKFQDCNFKFVFTPGNYTGAAATPAITNDEAASAIGLTVNPTPCTNLCGTYYSTSGATASASIAVCTAATAGTPDDDVWFSFIPTTPDNTITVRGAGGYDAVVQLFSDAGTTSVSCVNATANGLTETINATGLTTGNTYYVRIYHAGTGNGSTSDISICINQVILPPTNDNIASSTLLTVGATCTPTNSQLPSTLVATASPTTPAACNTADDDVWYSFVASTISDIVTVQSGAGYNASVQILSSSDNTPTGTLTQLACVNATSTAGVETYGGPWTIGNTYFVRVYHAASGAGSANFSICVTIPPAPLCTTNSSPADAATNVSVTPTLSWATATYATSYDVYIGTPDLAAAQAATPVNVTTASYLIPSALAYNTTYYWFVVPKNSTGAPSGCTGTSFTTAACTAPAATFTSQRIGTCPTATHFEVVVNVTSLGNAASIDITNNGGAPTISGVTAIGAYTVGQFSLGTSVLITLDHPTGTTCDVVSASQTQAVCPPPPPANDDCTSAVPLTVGNGFCTNPVNGTLVSAGASTGAPAVTCVSPLTNDVWYSVLVPAGQSVIVQTSAIRQGTGIGNDLVIQGVHSSDNTCTGTLSQKACDDDGNPLSGVNSTHSRITIANPGTTDSTYFVRVFPYGTDDVHEFSICAWNPSPASPMVVAPGVNNTCDAGITPITIDSANANRYTWIPIRDAANEVIAEINANGNNLGIVTASYFVTNNATLRTATQAGAYMNRNIEISVQNQPTTPVSVKLYFTDAEKVAMDAAVAGTNDRTDLRVTKEEATCAAFLGTSASSFHTLSANGLYGTDHFIQVEISSFSSFFIHKGPVTLPVTLSKVTASATGTTNTVSWTTASEANSSKFIVERSVNGSSFTAIGEVVTNAINGNSNTALNYNFVDVNPVQGKQYYRLQMVDRNGATKYSQTVTVRRGGNKLEIVDVRPNPTTGLVYFNVLGVSNNVNIAIRNLQGQTVINKNLIQANGFSVDLSSLATGMYILEAVDTKSQEKAVYKIVKQ